MNQAQYPGQLQGALGFSLEYGARWKVLVQNASAIELESVSVNGDPYGGIVLIVRGARGGTAAALLADQKSRLRTAGVFDLTSILNDKSVDGRRFEVLSPAVGDADAVAGSGLYEGHLKTAQSVSVPIQVVMMSATKGGLSVIVTAVVDARLVPFDTPPKQQQVWSLVDTVLETFLWPGELG